jgi:hypothetical protein
MYVLLLLIVHENSGRPPISVYYLCIIPFELLLSVSLVAMCSTQWSQ